jgi:stage V sporulation protein SpoVS
MSNFGKSARGGAGQGATHPYGRDEPVAGGGVMEDTEAGELETPRNSLKVSGTTDVNGLAQRICDLCRGDDPPALLTIGNQSINQAVKGIAVAHAQLASEGLEISFQPAFRHVNRTKPLIAFYLSTCPAGTTEMGTETELSVAAQSRITPVAGAIAGRIRDGLTVQLTAIGVDAVTNAVLAAGNARLFLEKDQLDIKIQPEFFKLTKNGSELSALRFTIVSEPF